MVLKMWLETANKSQNLNKYLLEKLYHDFYKNIVCKINKNYTSNSKIIPYPLVWLGFSYWKISKLQAKAILESWREQNKISIHAYHGVSFLADGENYES